jgi:hypothetical protein
LPSGSVPVTLHFACVDAIFPSAVCSPVTLRLNLGLIYGSGGELGRPTVICRFARSRDPFEQAKTAALSYHRF